MGRPSIDPIVLVKLMVAGAPEGIGSARELLRQAGVRLDLRRFLGYGLAERLPVHQTLSHAYTRRFVDAALFERLFLRSLELCKHGLFEGTHLSIDGFHAEADAALASLRASLALAPARARRAMSASRPRAAQDSSAGLPSTRSLSAVSRAGSVSAHPGRAALRPDAEAAKLEPDLGLADRSGGEAARQAGPAAPPRLPRPGAVDRKHRCIAPAAARRRTVSRVTRSSRCLTAPASPAPSFASLGADSGFAAERVWRAAERRGITAYIPPQPTMLPKAGEEATTEAQLRALAARARCKSPAGIEARSTCSAVSRSTGPGTSR